ncbi:MAG: flagellar brake protein [Oscillospiraceae bacterium]
MNTEKIIRLGAKLRVRAGGGWHATMIESLEDERTFFISPLLSMRERVELEKGHVYKIRAVNSRGLYEFDALVLDTGLRDANIKVSMTKLRMTTEPERRQRRNAFRVDVMLEVRVRELSDEDGQTAETAEYKSNTLNICETGMLLLARNGYKPGEMLGCDLVLNKCGMNETLRGLKAEVVRSKPPESDGGMHQVGVRFTQLHNTDRRTLTKFIMMIQREARQKAIKAD